MLAIGSLSSVPNVWDFSRALVYVLFILLPVNAMAQDEAHQKDNILEVNLGYMVAPHLESSIFGLDLEHLNRTHSSGVALTYEREIEGHCAIDGVDLVAFSGLYFLNSYKLSLGLGGATSKCGDSLLVRAGGGREFHFEEQPRLLLVPMIFADYVYQELEWTLSFGIGYRF